jgi:hypothetical protein
MTQQALDHLLEWASHQPKDVQRRFAAFYAGQVPSASVTVQDMEALIRDFVNQ